MERASDQVAAQKRPKDASCLNRKHIIQQYYTTTRPQNGVFVKREKVLKIEWQRRLLENDRDGYCFTGGPEIV